MKNDEIMLALRTNDTWPPEMESFVEAGYPLCDRLGEILDDPVARGSSIVRASLIEDAVRDFVAKCCAIASEQGATE